MNALAPAYPADTIEVRSLANGRPVILRPLGHGDADLLQDFVRRLSPLSRRMRFQSGLNELDPALLARLTEVDHCERVAFAAVIYEQGVELMIGEARYAPAWEDEDASEFAVAVADSWQHMGLGATLMDKLLRHARACGIARIHGDVLQHNRGMLSLAQRLGFALRPHPDGAWLARVTIDLEDASSPHPSDQSRMLVPFHSENSITVPSGSWT